MTLMMRAAASLQSTTSAFTDHGSGFKQNYTVPLLNRNKNCQFIGEKNSVGRRIRSSFRGVRAVIDQELPVEKKATVYEDPRKGAVVNAKVVAMFRRSVSKSPVNKIQLLLEAFLDVVGFHVSLQFVSKEIDPGTRRGKVSNECILKGWMQESIVDDGDDFIKCTVDLKIGADFGEIGAVLIVNDHAKEVFLENITIEGFSDVPVYFPCHSWVHSSKVNPSPRIFFCNQPYLPFETPGGLKDLRQKDLECKRGDGKGERKMSDRIYDYDVYNDLGNPDKSEEFKRPTLAGQSLPYPRRCRTGRPPTKTDPSAESRVEKPHPIYVPRDEAFEEIKKNTFSAGRLKALLHNLIPLIVATFTDPDFEFGCFSDIDELYKDGRVLKVKHQKGFLKNLLLLKIVKKLQKTQEQLLRYELPGIISRDRFAWIRDSEFARQTLAGVNPVNIKLLKEVPILSTLDPAKYGSPESSITSELIEQELNGISVNKAIEDNRLFILDHHDSFMPFLERINALKGRKAYASRTILFLDKKGYLRPIIIELSLPGATPGSKNSQIFTHGNDATSYWLWKLAKAHVCSNDAGIHQLVNHWLRTHACMEPYVIAANRQLSIMHPVFKLLQPHMRYTMEINALARQNLINGGGVIESCFSPERYSLELSSYAYDKEWRFDMESLPADLIYRGMAVEDPSQPHGMKLMIDDYPYAADGLLIWSQIKDYVEKYVSLYYQDKKSIKNDAELQAWWNEILEKGHPDKKGAPWWPKLESKEDLSGILTIMIWVSSGQHAALNFGQYPYGGYVPNRPCLMRKLIPKETDEDFKTFLKDPQGYFLSSLPTQLQATKTMAVVDTLSTHSPDEEYLGERHEKKWTNDKRALEAFEEFRKKVQDMEVLINSRNEDTRNKNRNGAGILPYELLIPTSGAGVTGRGIPNSISI